ncbi:hypothetical protein FKN04_13035 [Bacillus glycinifermentans]|uniref:hypothetical protein n=1 Tax=Bacillus glycinifermentans TaxID=1664069 RepID=UPI001583FC52|nr:hypothetical protein [Bacillus glycinifermentans]NUJ17501.1 hypothetical protein [Bacillus glycinifermentans]
MKDIIIDAHIYFHKYKDKDDDEGVFCEYRRDIPINLKDGEKPTDWTYEYLMERLDEIDTSLQIMYSLYEDDFKPIDVGEGIFYPVSYTYNGKTFTPEEFAIWIDKDGYFNQF